MGASPSPCPQSCRAPRAHRTPGQRPGLLRGPARPRVQARLLHVRQQLQRRERPGEGTAKTQGCCCSCWHTPAALPTAQGPHCCERGMESLSQFLPFPSPFLPPPFFFFLLSLLPPPGDRGSRRSQIVPGSCRGSAGCPPSCLSGEPVGSWAEGGQHALGTAGARETLEL